MKSEGPYQFIGGIVEGPDGSYKITSGEKYIQAIKAQSYAEGRKAAEKDLNNLIEAAHENGVFQGRKEMELELANKLKTSLTVEGIWDGVSKQAEKDFQELLALANYMENVYPGRYEHVERFKAWKKARGIE